jgi:hypothetical protein
MPQFPWYTTVFKCDPTLQKVMLGSFSSCDYLFNLHLLASVSRPTPPPSPDRNLQQSSIIRRDSFIHAITKHGIEVRGKHMSLLWVLITLIVNIISASVYAIDARIRVLSLCNGTIRPTVIDKIQPNRTKLGCPIVMLVHGSLDGSSMG